MAEAEKDNRRDKGDGSVYQRRSDGRWVGRYKDEMMPRAKYVYGKSEAEAKRKLREMRKQAIRGLGGDTKVLFNDYFERWLFYYKRNVIKPTSLDKYEETYHAFIEPYFRQRQLCGITAREIQELLDETTAMTSYTRAEKIFSLIKMCFKHAASLNDISPSKNPMHYVKLPDEVLYRKKRPIVVLNDDEVEKFEAAAYMKNGAGNLVYKYGPLMVLLMQTGLRRGELLALKWSDVDYKKKILHITRNLVRTRVFNNDIVRSYKYEYIEQTPKTKCSIRDIPLNQKAIHALERYKENCQKNDSLHEHIARTKAGEPLKPPTFAHVIKRVLQCAQIDVERYSLHCFRHTFATRLIKAGVELQQVSEWMGHSNVSTTMEVYQHLLDDDKRKALDILEMM